MKLSIWYATDGGYTQCVGWTVTDELQNRKEWRRPDEEPFACPTVELLFSRDV